MGKDLTSANTQKHSALTLLCALALSCALVLSLALTSCAKPAESESVDLKAAWLGTWTLTELTNNGTLTSAENVAQLKEHGFEVTLTLNDDKTVELTLFGMPAKGTWDATSESVAVATIEDQVIDMTHEGDVVTMSLDGITLSFAPKAQAG